MGVNQDLLFATMGANSEKNKGDFTGEHHREGQKENAAYPSGAAGGVVNLVPYTVFKPILFPNYQLYAYVLPEFGLTAGKDYTVVFDGDEYNCTAMSGTFGGMDVVTIGNTVLVDGTQTSVPFVVVRSPAMNATLVVCFDPTKNHTIQINGEKTVYPNVYAPNEYWVSILPTGVIGDDGNLIWHFSADWDELITAIKAGKHIYVNMTFVDSYVELTIFSYILGYAEIGVSPTEDCQYTDHLLFGSLQEYVSKIGDVVHVMRWSDGTVTVYNKTLSTQPT